MFYGTMSQRGKQRNARAIIALIILVGTIGHAQASVLFDSKNVTEYTIRIPTLKAPNILKRLSFGGSRKPTTKPSKGSAPSSSNLNPTFTSLNPSKNSSPFKATSSASFSANGPFKFPGRGSVMLAPGSFAFPPFPFPGSGTGKGPRGSQVMKMPAGFPSLWFNDPAIPFGPFNSKFSPTKISMPHKINVYPNGKARWPPGGPIPRPIKIADTLDAQNTHNNMRVVVLRPPPTTSSDSSLPDEDNHSGEDIRGYRGGFSKSSYKSRNHHSNNEPEIQIINLPPKKTYYERRRFFGSQRPIQRPTIIKVPFKNRDNMHTRVNQEAGLHFMASPSKSYIAEEKPLPNGRNSYLISEIDSKPDILNKIRNNVNGDSFSSDVVDDWNLSLPSKKTVTGPNFGADYGSLLDLQQTKQRLPKRQSPLIIALSGHEGHEQLHHKQIMRKPIKQESQQAPSPSIQVLRTDKDSKVVVPPGMIAILVPQSMNSERHSGLSSGSMGSSAGQNSEFDDDGQSFYESGTTPKKSVVPSPSTTSVEPSKQPGPPYKVSFTSAVLPPPKQHDFYPTVKFQNRIGDVNDSTAKSEESATTMPSVKREEPPKFHHPHPNGHQNINEFNKYPASLLYPKPSVSLPPRNHPPHQTAAPPTRPPSTTPLYSPNISNNRHGVRQDLILSQDRFGMPNTPPPRNTFTYEQNVNHGIQQKAPSPPQQPNHVYSDPPARREVNRETADHQNKINSTPNYLQNHRISSTPASYPPPAFDRETAAGFIPRASPMRVNGHVHSVPAPSRSQNTFSFHNEATNRETFAQIHRAVNNLPPMRYGATRRIGRQASPDDKKA